MTRVWNRINIMIRCIPVLIALWIAAASVLPIFPTQTTAPRIATISFEGNKSVPTPDLKALLERSREGGPYIPENLRSDLKRVESIYRDAGFLEAAVQNPDVQIQTAGNRATASIRITVVEGPHYNTGEISVKAAGELSPETLMQLSPFQKGQPYSRAKLSEWQAKIEEAYHSLGYMRAQCPVREMVKQSGKTVDCALECTEGKLYSVGTITVTGSGVNPVEFKRRLLVSEGAVFNPEMLSASIQFLNQIRLYERISSSDVEIKLDNERGIVDLTFRVLLRSSPQPGS